MLKKLLLIVTISIAFSICASAASLPARAATVRSIVLDGNGRMWVATFGNGLWLVDNSGPRQFFAAESGQPFPMINNLLISGKRLFIATAGGGCVVLNTDTLRFEPIIQTAGFEKLHALTQTSSGTIYIGSVGSGTATLLSDAWKPMIDKESSQLAWVNSIAEWQGSLWLGTATGLYVNTSDQKWKPVGTELRRAVNCLLVQDNVLYAGTTDRGVYAIKDGDYPSQVEGTLWPINFLTTFSGQIIAGGNLGLWSIKNAQAEEITSDITDPKCAFASGKKNLLLGTMDGKIYTSEDGRTFRLTMSFTENGLEEHKQ